MMRADVAAQAKSVLESAGCFAKVCGLGFETKQPGALCRVWLQGTHDRNLEDKPAHVELRVILQIETTLATDAEGDTVDGPLYDLVDQVFAVLHNYKMPGAGSHPFVVIDSPGFKGFDQETGRAIYVLQAPVKVIPNLFSLT